MPETVKNHAKNRLCAFPKHENASLALIQGKYRFFRLFYAITWFRKTSAYRQALVTTQRLIGHKGRGFESRSGPKTFAQFQKYFF